MKRNRNTDEGRPEVGTPGRESISLADILNRESADRSVRSRRQDRGSRTIPRNDAVTGLNRPSVRASLVARTDDSTLGLHWAVWGGLANVVEFQLRNGTSVHCRDQHGNTALHWAAGSGHVTVVDLLLMAGADPHAVNLDGATPLTLATERGHARVIDRLQLALPPARALGIPATREAASPVASPQGAPAPRGSFPRTEARGIFM